MGYSNSYGTNVVDGLDISLSECTDDCVEEDEEDETRAGTNLGFVLSIGQKAQLFGRDASLARFMVELGESEEDINCGEDEDATKDL